MIKGYSNEKYNTSTTIFLACDTCNADFKKPNYRYYVNIEKPKHPEKDYCNSCWRSILNNRKEYKDKMSRSLKNTYINDPTLKTRISESCKGINKGDKNGMKSEAARKKASISRKKLMEDPEFRKKISIYTKKAWADGKYDNVKVGRCKWYSYTNKKGIVYKVQGTYELKFINWLDNNNLTFKVHKNNIKYLDDNNDYHLYYPDFFVEEWDSYVEIKSNYYYELSKNKIKNIIKSNPKLKLIVLKEKEMRELGIKI